MPSSPGRFHVQTAADIHPVAGDAAHASGVRETRLIGQHVGAVHTGVSLWKAASGGHVDEHVHSTEQSFYVLEGNPQLTVDGRAFQLAPNDCGLLPVGVPHAWHARGDLEAVWAEVTSPAPRLSVRLTRSGLAGRQPRAMPLISISAIPGPEPSSASVAARWTSTTSSSGRRSTRRPCPRAWPRRCLRIPGSRLGVVVCIEEVAARSRR